MLKVGPGHANGPTGMGPPVEPDELELALDDELELDDELVLMLDDALVPEPEEELALELDATEPTKPIAPPVDPAALLNDDALDAALTLDAELELDVLPAPASPRRGFEQAASRSAATSTSLMLEKIEQRTRGRCCIQEAPTNPGA